MRRYDDRSAGAPAREGPRGHEGTAPPRPPCALSRRPRVPSVYYYCALSRGSDRQSVARLHQLTSRRTGADSFSDRRAKAAAEMDLMRMERCVTRAGLSMSTPHCQTAGFGCTPDPPLAAGRVSHQKFTRAAAHSNGRSVALAPCVRSTIRDREVWVTTTPISHPTRGMSHTTRGTRATRPIVITKTTMSSGIVVRRRAIVCVPMRARARACVGVHPTPHT